MLIPQIVNRAIPTMFAIMVIAFTFQSCIPDASGKEDITNRLSIGKGATNFIVVSDWGRNGFYNQQEVANEMGRIADSVHPRFIVSCGDNFQLNGVQSTRDPLWQTNFENIYTRFSLHVDWYPVLGNHDYQGNTQAQIDYSDISRRWKMYAHYYTLVQPAGEIDSVRLVFLDTPPLIDYYYAHPQKYPDIALQDSLAQLNWLREVLASNKAKWIMVFGHHPVYSSSTKHGSTKELIQRLQPIFEKYHVDFYLSGHDHDLQHLTPTGYTTEYIVTGAGSQVRDAATDSNTVFSIAKPGFTFISIKDNELRFSFIDKEGGLLYSHTKKK